MLDLLHHIERRLPDLLSDAQGWASLDIDYHPPRVERVFRDVDGTRVSLHVIHPCEPEHALFHPHPWPSAMRVLAGTYEMGVGASHTAERPSEVLRLVAPAGLAYEMTRPDGWHWVRAVGSPALTVMVSGAPWVRGRASERRSLAPLGEQRVQEILRLCRAHYPA